MATVTAVLACTLQVGDRLAVGQPFRIPGSERPVVLMSPAPVESVDVDDTISEVTVLLEQRTVPLLIPATRKVYLH